MGYVPTKTLDRVALSSLSLYLNEEEVRQIEREIRVWGKKKWFSSWALVALLTLLLVHDYCSG